VLAVVAKEATIPPPEKLARMELQTGVVVEVVAVRPTPTTHTQLEATAVRAS
jgi:hypothetical protein